MTSKAALPQGIQTGSLQLDKQMEHCDIAEGYCRKLNVQRVTVRGCAPVY